MGKLRWSAPGFGSLTFNRLRARCRVSDTHLTTMPISLRLIEAEKRHSIPSTARIRMAKGRVHAGANDSGGHGFPGAGIARKRGDKRPWSRTLVESTLSALRLVLMFPREA